MCGYLNALKDKLTDTPVVEITLNRTPSSSQQQQQWLDQPEAVTGPINNSLVEVVQIYIYKKWLPFVFVFERERERVYLILDISL
jgi:hypothetical protein